MSKEQAGSLCARKKCEREDGAVQSEGQEKELTLRAWSISAKT